MCNIFIYLLMNISLLGGVVITVTRKVTDTKLQNRGGWWHCCYEKPCHVPHRL